VTELDEEVAARFARSRDTDLRVAIIEYFDRRDSPRVVSQVKALLLGDELLGQEFVRAGSNYLSSQLSEYDPQLIERYQEIAQDSDLLTASIVIEAIGRSGAPTAIDTLLGLYEKLTQTDQRSAILRALGHTGSAEALPLLSRIARDEFEESALRHYAAESLGRIESAESVELLTELLSDDDAVLRAYATRALGFYPSETSLPYLHEALLDSFWRVRVAALQGIAEQGASDAVGAVAYKAHRDPERPVREEAIRTLGAIANREAAEALAEVLTDERAAETLRMSAARALLAIDPRSHREAFEQVLADEWNREGSRLLDTVAKGLSEAGEFSFESFYLRFLDHPNFVIRIYGIRGIGNAGLSSRVEALKEIARQNPRGILRTSALTALQQLGINFNPEQDTEDRNKEEGENARAE